MPTTPFVTPRSTEQAARLLAVYPHVAHCPTCCGYADAALIGYPSALVLTATLAYHDAQHATDPLVTASEHFSRDE